MKVNETHLIYLWNGTTHVQVEVTVQLDTADIANRIGQAALRNKSGKSEMCGGAIKVTAELH